MALLESVTHRKPIAGYLTWFGLWVFVTVVAIILTPSEHGHGTHTQLGLPPCPSVLFFGRPCPGCGLTTSFTAFVHGQWGTALQAHPFGPLLYLGFTVSAWGALIGFLRRTRLNTAHRGLSLGMTLFVAAFVLFGVIRFIAAVDYAKNDPIQPLIGSR